MFSVDCCIYSFLPNDFNTLKNCLKFNQVNELSQKQRKFWYAKKLSAELSTRIVESFPLDLTRLRLQPGPRIIKYPQ